MFPERQNRPHSHSHSPPSHRAILGLFPPKTPHFFFPSRSLQTPLKPREKPKSVRCRCPGRLLLFQGQLPGVGNPQIPPFPAFFQPGKLRPHLAELRSHLSLPRRQSPSEERSPETPRFGALGGFFFLFFFWGRFSSLAKEFFCPQVRGGNEKLLPVPSRSSRAEERNNLYKFRARDAPRLALFAPISAFFWGRKKKNSFLFPPPKNSCPGCSGALFPAGEREFLLQNPAF